MAAAAGDTTEPEWPTWVPRRASWSRETTSSSGCACAWLRLDVEDLALYGLPAQQYASCSECGAVWSSGA